MRLTLRPHFGNAGNLPRLSSIQASTELGITGVISPSKEGKVLPMWLRAVCAVLLLVVIHGRPALSEVPEGTWLLANRVAVQVFECTGQLCGRIVWLVKPRTPDGQPDVDHLNPDPTLRQRQLCGLTIIWGLQPDGPDHWSSGWLYDPQDGVTYDVTAELTAPNTISARVYRGVPFFGRTEILVRDPPLSFEGRC
jgi:uncharacterized protein (DUF2147 family)